jgi:hypothetical protein
MVENSGTVYLFVEKPHIRISPVKQVCCPQGSYLRESPSPANSFVARAKAGIFWPLRHVKIPAYAGMTSQK